MFPHAAAFAARAGIPGLQPQLPESLKVFYNEGMSACFEGDLALICVCGFRQGSVACKLAEDCVVDRETETIV